ncbi:sensor histidine kinase [Romboutsia ilealis]|uniref:sensor histidine kinase n=1 Tax=Romboutsia ilealis TaxID=1115758 RepID=UPI0025A4CFC7|nr:sensor histidine kinase [Romboutsia ilealis]
MFFIFTNSKNVYSLERKEILFISSYNPNFISFNDQINGIVESLGEDINLHTEYMDSKITDNESNERDFYNLLKYNISNYKKYESIIVGDDEALEFAIKYRDDIFKDIPIVFLGVEDTKLIQDSLKYNLVSGVRESESLGANIELIAKLHKNVKNIYIITEDLEILDRSTISLEEGFYTKEGLNINTIVTKNMSINEFKEKLSTLDEDDGIITFYPNHFKNKYWIGHEDITKLIKHYTNNVAIYSALGYNINNGSIGGKVVNHYNQGKKAGEIVKAILEGKDAKKLYIDKDNANEYVFDYHTMKEFNIKKRDLPEGSIIINDPIAYILKHKELSLSILLFVFGLISIIFVLIFYIIYKIKYQKELLCVINESNEVNRLKSYFISNITHELRTPITVITSVMQLTKSNKHDEDFILKVNNAKIIDDNCNRLLRLINNIIDIDKYKYGNMTLNLEKVNIVELSESVVMSILPYVKARNLEIIFDTTEEEIMMNIDCNKIERVLLNLLSNAIKFSNKGGTIRVNLIKNNDILRIEVEDNGIGIKEDNLHKIFDKFVQLDSTMTRKNEGSGIGLSIVKSFVELHNGNISVVSKINEGSIFKVDLPIVTEEIEYKEYSEDEIINKSKLELSDIYM